MSDYLHPRRSAVQHVAYAVVGACGGISTITRENGKQYPELNGYRLLQRIFREAGTGVYGMIPGGYRVADRLDEVIRQGYWIRKQPIPPYDTVDRLGIGTEEGSLAWCGIFAAWVLKEAHLNARWDQKIVGSDIEEIGQYMRSAPANWRDTLDVGDVGIVDSRKQHHCIIVMTFPDSDRLFTVEGNIPFPQRHSIILCDSRHKADFHAAYKLKI